MIAFSKLGQIGRLGNNLFQVASMLGIANKLKTTAGFPEWKYAEYFKHPLTRFHQKPSVTIKEKSYHYDAEFLKDAKPNYNYDIEGYFQSEKYWQHCEDVIKKQFEFKDDFKENIRLKFGNVLNSKTVAISIRRGDFVKNKYYYQIPIHYYLSAYYKHFPGYNILIFSDDFKYCKLHFESVPNVTYAEGLNDIEQLCLMSLCENFIISNSTFSWWGAYLSGSKNVIRPVKNLSDEYAKTNDEKDYWLPYMNVNNDKIDLRDTTFVIPVFYDHNDRRLNVMLTVGFLLKNFHTNIIIGEQGGNSFEFMSKYVTYTNFNEIKYFHRTKMLNDLIKMAKTKVVVNWDGDNICAPAQLAESVNLINNGADMVYPFDGRVARVPRYLFNSAIESLDVHDIDLKQCMPKTFTSVGHAVVMNKESFIKAGMENENMISWAPEDSERYDRFNMLGFNVKRVKGTMFHMDHFCGPNSSTNHPHFQANNMEFYKVKQMKKEQLVNYVNTWPWPKI